MAAFTITAAEGNREQVLKAKGHRKDLKPDESEQDRAQEFVDQPPEQVDVTMGFD